MEFKRFLGNLAKTYLAIGALSVSAFAGADDYHYQNGCAPVCAPACAPACNECCGMPCNPPPACAWGYNPPAYCHCGCNTCCDGWDGFSARIDFLWWRACEEGLSLGIEESFDESRLDSTHLRLVNDSRTKNPDFKYDPGFRIGIGHNCCDCWDWALNWTHFHTKAKTHFSECFENECNTDVDFFSCWERLEDRNPQIAKARYTLNLDYLDLEFGYKYYVSNCFAVRPYFGLRGARIDQNYRVISKRNSSSTNPLPGEDWESVVKAKNDWLSIGPRVGAYVELQLGCGLKIFGDAAGSMLFGKFDRHAKEHHRDFGFDSEFVSEFDYNAKSSQDRCSRTVSDLSIGFRWDHCYEWCGRYHPVSIAFAWEHHAFYDLNNFLFDGNAVEYDRVDDFHCCACGGDLTTQGLTVSVNFGF